VVFVQNKICRPDSHYGRPLRSVSPRPRRQGVPVKRRHAREAASTATGRGPRNVMIWYVVAASSATGSRIRQARPVEKCGVSV